MLNLGKDHGPDSTVGSHDRVGSLAGAADGEARYNLFQFFIAPTSQELPSETNAEDPRILLQELLPYLFFRPTERFGVIAKELCIFK